MYFGNFVWSHYDIETRHLFDLPTHTNNQSGLYDPSGIVEENGSPISNLEALKLFYPEKIGRIILGDPFTSEARVRNAELPRNGYSISDRNALIHGVFLQRPVVIAV